jgi:hypothetical protein
MMKFKRTVTYTGEESIFTPAQFIEEVNAERSDSWAPYTIKDALTIPNEIMSHWLNNDHESWEVLPS